MLYEKLFEEKILGNLTEDRFKKLSEKYEDEQAELTQRIRHMKKVVAEEQKHELNAEGFLQLARRYTDIQELTPEILREFIDKIVVHHREKQGKETFQQVDIYYRFIGHVVIAQAEQASAGGVSAQFWAGKRRKPKRMKRFGLQTKKIPTGTQAPYGYSLWCR